MRITEGGGYSMTALELHDAVSQLETLSDDLSADDRLVYFCSAHTPAFSSFEAGFDQHMREVHGEPNWREYVIGSIANAETAPLPHADRMSVEAIRQRFEWAKKEAGADWRMDGEMKDMEVLFAEIDRLRADLLEMDFI